MSGQSAFTWAHGSSWSRTYSISGTGPDDSFFKVRADDGNLYILRQKLSPVDKIRGAWNRSASGKDSVLAAYAGRKCAKLKAFTGWALQV
jgi:hypothetical protein